MCFIIAGRLREQRKQGIEPCMSHINALRLMEQEYKVERLPL